MADQLSNSTTSKPTFAQDFRRFFVRGLALILPPIFTVVILLYLWDLLTEYVGRPANYAIRYATGLSVYVHDRWAESPTEQRESWVAIGGDPTKRGQERPPYVPGHRYEFVKEKLLQQNEKVPQTVPSFYEKYIQHRYWARYHLSWIGLLVALVFIYFVGRFLATFIGRSIWEWIERTVVRLPIVRAVYPHVKQFIDFLLSEKKLQYNRVVAVQYPRAGMWSLGLVTGEGIAELEEKLRQELITVFIPYTPWSVAGYAITLPRSEVLDLSVSVDEAMRFVVSGGVIRPRGHGLPPKATDLLIAAPAGNLAAAGSGPQRPAGARSQRVIRVGTRGSQLARAQADWVVERLRELDPERGIELLEIKTSGDRAAEAKLREIGGEGVFTKEIQRALAAGEIDVGVHSLKDLPTAPLAELLVAAVPRRAPALDVLVAPRFADWRSLPPGARIGTSSPRRRGQLLRLRGDLVIEEIRGNVPTRLEKIDDLGLAGVVLAHAGLQRLGLEDRVTYRFTTDEMLPAPAQGALGIECRADDRELIDLLGRLDDPPTRRATTAERAVLAHLAGGCHLPLGAYATVAEGQLGLRAVICSSNGASAITDSLVGCAEQADSLGRALADRLIAAGARELL